MMEYIVEHSLSFGNLFVFFQIIRFVHVPEDAQEVILGYVIVGAMVLHQAMIVGSKLLVNLFE